MRITFIYSQEIIFRDKDRIRNYYQCNYAKRVSSSVEFRQRFPRLNANYCTIRDPRYIIAHPHLVECETSDHWARVIRNDANIRFKLRFIARTHLSFGRLVRTNIQSQIESNKRFIKYIILNWFINNCYFILINSRLIL